MRDAYFIPIRPLAWLRLSESILLDDIALFSALVAWDNADCMLLMVDVKSSLPFLVIFRQGLVVQQFHQFLVLFSDLILKLADVFKTSLTSSGRPD